MPPPPVSHTAGTRIKTGILVLGLLLLTAGVAMHFAHVNVIATDAILALGGLSIITSLIFRLVKWKHTHDIGTVSQAVITPEQAAQIVRENPHVVKLIVTFFHDPNARNATWNPDITPALSPYFKPDWGARAI